MRDAPPTERGQRDLDTDTHSDRDLRPSVKQRAVTMLTVLCHVDLARVGEMAWLADLDRGHHQPLSRLAPGFARHLGADTRPLGDPRLSRRPLRLVRRGNRYVIEIAGSGIRLTVDGTSVDEDPVIEESRLEQGVVLQLGQRVTLLLHRGVATVKPPPSFDLIGESAVMVQLRRMIDRVAPVDVPVLIRGESGTGKELVAQAIQKRSRRRQQAFRSVHLGAVPAALAAAELFGATRGSYSGADRDRVGYFRQCDGGTIFLDELGEAPPEVQALLLRVLESGEIQPVGASGSTRVDVRVLAATDAVLETAVENDRFKAPLLHRLQAFEITVPALRERRDDLGRLFVRFVHQAMAHCGEPEWSFARETSASSFVPASMMTRLALHDWPGNVRELRNVAFQTVIASRGDGMLALPEGWPARTRNRASSANEDRTMRGATKAAGQTKRVAYRDPSSVGEDELRAALADAEWNLLRAAAALGISRGSLYALIERSPSLRTAADLTRAEIAEGWAEYEGDLVALARHLQVSTQALKRRLHQEGIP